MFKKISKKDNRNISSSNNNGWNHRKHDVGVSCKHIGYSICD